MTIRHILYEEKQRQQCHCNVLFSRMFIIEDVLLFQAIGSRNLLKSVAKQREAQQQQLHALIAEKRMQLERYNF